eukprot:5881480-Ditylum_brightwellii.AAC.1
MELQSTREILMWFDIGDKRAVEKASQALQEKLKRNTIRKVEGKPHHPPTPLLCSQMEYQLLCSAL